MSAQDRVPAGVDALTPAQKEGAFRSAKKSGNNSEEKLLSAKKGATKVGSADAGEKVIQAAASPAAVKASTSNPLLERHWQEVISKCRLLSVFIFLTLGNMGYGLVEFATNADLPDIATTFNITVSEAASMTELFMLTAAVSSMFFATVAVKWSKRAVLIGALFTLAVSAGISIWSPLFEVLVTMRMLAAMAQAPYTAVAIPLLSALVPPVDADFRWGRIPVNPNTIVAYYLAGWVLSQLLFVPVATYLGDLDEDVGSWRYIFAPGLGVVLIAGVGVIASLPSGVKTQTTQVKEEAAIFKKPLFWLLIMGMIFAYSGMIGSHTYFANMMFQVGFSNLDLSWLNAIFGLGVFLGNTFLGPKLIEHKERLIPPVLLTLIGVLTSFYFIVSLADPENITFRVLGALELFLNGFLGFSLVPPFFVLASEVGKEGPTLASASVMSAFGLGIGFAIWLGGFGIALAEGANATLGNGTTAMVNDTTPPSLDDLSPWGGAAPKWISAALSTFGAIFVFLTLCINQKQRKNRSAEGSVSSVSSVSAHKPAPRAVTTLQEVVATTA